MHQGLFGFSLFEVLFGRKANGNIELGDKVLVKMKICNKKIRGKHKTFDIIKGKKISRKETL